MKDRLLTDTMLNQQQLVVGATSHTDSSCTSQEDLTVNAEHSYSLGGSTSTNSTFGSDGDSMPESPLSLDDGNHFFFLFLYFFFYVGRNCSYNEVKFSFFLSGFLGSDWFLLSSLLKIILNLFGGNENHPPLT